VVFELNHINGQLEDEDEQNLSISFFKMCTEVSKFDLRFFEVINNPTFCDLDSRNLSSILKKYKGKVHFDGVLYTKAILWADILIYNRSKGQNIKSIVGLLNSLLKKDQEPISSHGFKPIEKRFKKIDVLEKAQKCIDSSQESVRLEDQIIRDTAIQTWANYTELQQERLRGAIYEVIFKNNRNSTWKPKKKFYDFRSIEIIENAINFGLSTSDLTGLIKWYKERNT
jgi:hypothetical protein